MPDGFVLVPKAIYMAPLEKTLLTLSGTLEWAADAPDVDHPSSQGPSHRQSRTGDRSLILYH